MEKNDLYNIEIFNKFKEDLVKYNLFSSIEINADKPIAGNDNYIHTSKSDIIVDINEDMLREISASVKFNTTDWLGLVFNWKHHNIDEKGSNIELISNIDKNNPKAIFNYKVYDILLPKQYVLTQVFGLIENTTTHRANKIGMESMLGQSINRYLYIEIEGNWEKSKTFDKVSNEDQNENKYIDTFGIPMAIKFDNADNF